MARSRYLLLVAAVPMLVGSAAKAQRWEIQASGGYSSAYGGTGFFSASVTPMFRVLPLLEVGPRVGGAVNTNPFTGGPTLDGVVRLLLYPVYLEAFGGVWFFFGNGASLTVPNPPFNGDTVVYHFGGALGVQAGSVVLGVSVADLGGSLIVGPEIGVGF